MNVSGYKGHATAISCDIMSDANYGALLSSRVRIRVKSFVVIGYAHVSVLLSTVTERDPQNMGKMHLLYRRVTDTVLYHDMGTYHLQSQSIMVQQSQSPLLVAG